MRVRCPNCHDSTEVDDSTDLSGIECPSCGSKFSLVGDHTLTYSEAESKTIGHFELVDEIGSGAFGSVWMARDTQLDRSVAVKIPRKGQLDAAETEQFVREARAAAQLKHPNIVAVHEVGRQDGQVYIVSDYVEGLTLADWLVGQQLTSRTAAELCLKLAEALHHAHEQGVIHRDLKPTNIIIDRENEPHIMDFGLAKREAGEVTMTMEGKVLGTPAYMSPEQAKGEAHQADRRSDVYSLGVILYELLTGHKPFRGNVRMLLQQVINEDAPSPRRLNSSIPRDLETLCLKCLEKDPRKRYYTAKDVAEELKRFLRGEPIQARPITTTARTWRWCKRNPMGATVAALLLFLAVAGPLAAINQTRLARSAEDAADRARQAEQKAWDEAVRADHEASIALQRAYISDMNLAAQSWEAGDLMRTRELLDRHRPVVLDSSSSALPRSVDLRGFEWRLLWGLANDDQTTMKLDDLPVTLTCVALSPATKYLAWGGADGSVNIIDFKARRAKIALRELSSRIRRLAYSSDGRWLAAGCDDGTIQLWEVGSWRDKPVLAGHTGSIRDLVFHPDGTHLTSIGTDATIRIWNITDAREAQFFNNPEPGRQISISSDATTVATFGGLDSTVRFWQLRDDPGHRRYVELHRLPPQKGIILSVALSRNGDTAVISSHDSQVSLWDIATLKRLAKYSQKVLVTRLALSADDQTLVTAGSDNLLKVWDVESGHEIRTLRGHPSTPSQLALSAEGTSLASVGSGNTLRVWAISSSEERNRLLHNGIVVFLAVSPDGQTLATSDPSFFTVKLWDLSTLKSTDFFVGEKCQVAFSADGKWFAVLSGDGQVRLWDRSTTPYGTEPGAEFGSSSGVGNHLTFSHGSKILALRGQHDAVVLWDVAKQEVMGALQNHSGTCATAFRTDDEIIATASNRQIRLWEVSSGHLLAAVPGQSGDIRSLCFSPDGQLLAAGSGNTELRWWDVSDPTDPRGLPPLRGHTAKIVAVAFSPDGKTLATGGRDSTLRLWDVSSRQQVAMLQGHSSVVESLAWSHDGSTIFTGSGDASVRLWHAPSWKEIEVAESRQSTEGQPQ